MEKRLYPRITTSFPLRITPDILGEAVDISETGLGFTLEKPLLLSKATAKIEVSPKESIETEFKVIWNKHLVERNGFRYGACFIRLKERDIDTLRELLIQTHIESILNGVEDSQKRQKTLKFWLKDFKEYITELDFLARDIKNKKITLLNAYKKLDAINGTILQKGNEIELLHNNKVIAKKIKDTFRLLCGPWAYQGKIVKYALEKPRGYPGDYKLLEMIYDNKSISEDIGYCSDKYLLNDKYAVGVRNRKDMMHGILLDYIKNNSLDEINILNIACGSSREIEEIFMQEQKMHNKKIVFTLVDQDKEALDFSKKVLNSYKHNNFQVNYFQHNILDYVKKPETYKKILDKQDMIYSIGLADYLPDRILKNFILFCYDILKPNGVLVLAHKDIAKYKPLGPDWWCNWTFYPRDENYFIELVTKCGISNFKINKDREKSGIILFLFIHKGK